MQSLKDLEEEANKGFEFEGASGGKKTPINFMFFKPRTNSKLVLSFLTYKT
jgi:hypothetical protein